MRAYYARWMLVVGLATGSLLGTISDVAADRDDRRDDDDDDDDDRARRRDDRRDDRRDRRDRRRDRYDTDNPREAPPPARAERPGRRRGFVWISGHWDWRRGQGWVWTAGRYEKRRAGRRFTAVRWERRGNVYVRIDGSWNDVGAPPPLKEERFDPRPGWVFIRGSWEWDERNDQWLWTAGRWERERRGRRWRDRRWEQKNGEWVSIDGGWEDAPAVVHSPYPNQAPPANRPERPSTRPGYVWDPGHWEWRNGQFDWVDGHFEQERGGFTWRPGRWELRNSRWEWTAGSWEKAPVVSQYPTSGPPGPKQERSDERAGFDWIPGRWDWKNGQWVWLEGRYEKERETEEFVQGRWENRGGRWEWIEGRWQPFPEWPSFGPPTKPAEQIQTRAGWQWRYGFYEWRRGKYTWKPGLLVQGHDGEHHIALEWVQRGNVWRIQVDRWERDAVAEYPTQGPPAPREENAGRRRGEVFIRGHYEWRNGKYEWTAGRWVKAQPNKFFIQGRWENRNNRWDWIDGSWGAVPQHPPLDFEPPPAFETAQTRQGHIWQPGRWNWDGSGEYTWIAGQLVPERRGFRFQAGRWVKASSWWRWEDHQWIEDRDGY